MSCYCGERDCPDCSGAKWDPAYWKRIDSQPAEYRSEPAMKQLPSVGDLVKTKAGWWGILMFIKADQVKVSGTGCARPGKYMVYAPGHTRADDKGLVTSLSGNMLEEIQTISSFKECVDEKDI